MPVAAGRRLTRTIVWTVLAALVALPAAAQVAPAPVELTDATVVDHERAVEVWVRLSREARYQSDMMDGPDRLVLDFEDTAYRWTKVAVPVAADPVRALRGSQFRKGVARLVIEFQHKVPYTIESDREGLRIVIPKVARSAAPATPELPAPSGRALAAPLVYGIIRLDNRAHAYIFDPATRQVRRYAEGDALGDGVVEKIDERHVVLKTPSGRVELPVSEARPGSAPRPSDATTPRGIRPPPAPVGPAPTSPRS